MKKSMFLPLVALLLCACGENEFRLRSGDLIFQDSSSSEVENSIRSVTSSIRGYNFTHVGMVDIKPDGSVYVLEAVPPTVKYTPLAEYLYPSGSGESGNPRSVVGRLKKPYRKLIPAAIEEGKKLLGLGYDYAYTLGDDKYYCSEYIYEILKTANGGGEVFPLNVMTFCEPGSDEISEGWIRYYEKLGVPVPEGEPGINPGAMSRSGVIDIIYFY